MVVSLGTPERAGAWTLYPLRVEASGSPLIAVLGDGVRQSQLIVDGQVVQSTDRGGPGFLPFGHGVQSLRLAGLRAGNRVTIALQGSAAPPRIVGNLDVVGVAFDSGMGAGIYFGILLVILLFQIVAFAALKDPTFLWYAFWIASVLTFELAFDGLLPLVPGSAGYSLATINLLSQLAYVGFVTSYLNLRRSAPRLFVIFIGASMFTAAVPALAGIVLRHPAPQSYITVLFACSMGLAIVIAMLRRQAGFTPAAFLVFGLLGSFTMMALSALRDFVGPSSSLLNSAFLDRWSVQLGFVFDFLVFSIGVAYRARFAYGESVKIHAELDEATSAAGHDPLTGLLNRRGLERWIAASTPCAGTVLFFDLDDFKMVNDRGGHAAGDEVLNLVGHIIRQSVREHDAVSRFGGDEFVVVLDGATEPALIEHIVARITAAVARLLPLGPQSDARIGISFGTAPLAPGTSFADALGRADVEAYRMKTEHHARR